jgi:hypothetical protein
MGAGLRWENNFIRKGAEFSQFWTDYLASSERNVCYIMGIGFDPRTNHGISKIFSLEGKGVRKCIAFKYKKDNLVQDRTPNQHVLKHTEVLEKFLKETVGIDPVYKDLITRSDEDKSIASISSSKIINSADLEGFTDIIVDISAMSRGVFLPLINKMLFLIDQQTSPKQNLHIVVAENPVLDSAIEDKGVEEQMTFPHGFRISDIAKTDEYSKIWIPMLGEGQLEQFKIINKELEPVAVCPVLPFPSINLKRGDNLINYYQDYLFNDPDFEPNNIIYADEQNPFQIYRLLTRTIDQYHNTFKILGGCKIILSTLSSKLMTIGAFMAFYESKKQDKIVGIAHVESIDHHLDDQCRTENSENDILYEIWLTGEPYGE